MSLSQTWFTSGGRKAFVPSIVSLSPRGIPEEFRPEDSTDETNTSSTFWVLSSGPNTLVRIGSVASDLLVTTESTSVVLSTISTSTSSAPSGFEGSLIVPLYVLIFLLSVGGNCLVLATLAQNKRMRTVTNVFLLNLAVSDLLLGVFCMPFTLVGQLLRNFVFGPIMCKLIPYFQAVSVSVSVWTLVAISLERYFAICRPLRSRRWQTRFHAYKMIAAVWVSSLLWSVPILVVSRLKALKGNLGGRHKCREEWPSPASERGFNLFVDAALLVIPLIVMALAYSLIVSKLWKGLRRELVHRRGVHGGCTNNHHTCTNLRTPCRLMRQQHMEHHTASATTRLGGSSAELSHSMPAAIGETQGVNQGGLNGRCFSANLHRQPIPSTLQHHFTIAAERCSRTSSAASHLRLFFARISRCWKTSPQPTAPPDLVLPVQQPLSQSPGRPGSVVALDGGEGTGEAANDVSVPCPFNRHAAVRSTYVDKSVESKRKVIRMLFVVVLEFFVCWTPLHVLNTVYLFNPEAVYSTVGATGVSLVQLLAYAASCTNPITYCFMNRRFRAAFRRVFDCCSSRGVSGVGPGVLGSENTGMGAAIRRGRRGRRRRGRQRGKTLWRWHSAAGPLGGRSADCAFSTAIATELGVASEDASGVESALDLGATCRHSGCSKSEVVVLEEEDRV